MEITLDKIKLSVTRCIEEELPDYLNDIILSNESNQLEINKLKDENSNLKNELHEKTNHITLLTSNYEKLKNEMLDFQKVSYVKSLNDRITSKEKEIETLQHKLTKALDTIENYKKTNSELNYTLDKLPTNFQPNLNHLNLPL